MTTIEIPGLTPHIDRSAFEKRCADLPTDEVGAVAKALPELFRERFADMTTDEVATVVRAFPHLYRDCIGFDGASVGALPAKSTAPTSYSDREAIKALILESLATKPDQRSEEIAADILPEKEREDGGKVVRRELERFVDEKKVYKAGERRAARYKLVTPRAEAAE